MNKVYHLISTLFKRYKNKNLVKKYSNLLTKACELLNTSTFVICDVGARRNLIHPWDILDKNDMVLTYGFEPEPEEAKNLNKNFPSRKYQPYAAADKDGYLKLTVANDPGCSSIYPPDIKYIEDSFLIENATVRYTTKTVEIPSRRIDSVVEDVDFIKIDTQGYEYEVLSGASKILPNVPAILTECWSVPIHKGQYLTHDVTKLMYDKQFEVLSIENGSWRRLSPKNKYPAAGTTPVWQEILFLNKNYSSFSKEKQKKLVIILLMYGHFGFAAKLSKTLLDISLDKLLENYVNQCKPFNPYFPNLHY